MNIEKFIIENNLQEPKTFEDILKLQKILDDNLHNARNRTVEDIKLSLITEIIEFNEETKDSHKTWKNKEYSREKELEELTDIYFFFAQLINFLKRDEKYYCFKFNTFNSNDRKVNCLSLIKYLQNEALAHFLDNLINISKKHSYTKEDILKTYWRKWKINMERIGKEWN